MADDTNIPEMNLDKNYSAKNKIVPENTEKDAKNMDKTKKELEKLKIKEFVIFSKHSEIQRF